MLYPSPPSSIWSLPIKFSKKSKSWSSPYCHFVHLPVTTSILFGADVPLGTLFLVRCSVSATDQVVYQQNNTLDDFCLLLVELLNVYYIIRFWCYLCDMCLDISCCFILRSLCWTFSGETSYISSSQEHVVKSLLPSYKHVKPSIASLHSFVPESLQFFCS